MKGVVYNLFEEAVVEKFGADIWDDLLDDAGVAGAYTSLGNYTDDEMIALVEAAAAKLDMTSSDGSANRRCRCSSSDTRTSSCPTIHRAASF